MTSPRRAASTPGPGPSLAEADAAAAPPRTGAVPRLRVGLICPGTVFPSWQAEAIRNLNAVNGVEISLLILDVGCDESDGTRPGWHRYLWRQYRHWAARLRTEQRDRSVDLTDALSGVARWPCRASQGGPLPHRGSSADVETLAQYNLDVILHFGRNDIRGDLLRVARYGVWSFRSLGYRGGPVGFWEIYFGDPLSGAMLQRLGETPSDEVTLRQGHFRTITDSYTQNRDHIVRNLATWPALTARLLLHGLAEEVFRPSPSRAATAPIVEVPTNREMAAYAGRLTRNVAVKQVSDLFGHSESGADEWAIGVTTQSVASLLAQNSSSPVQWLTAPEGRFFADPFVITRGPTTYIFFEDYSRKDRKGRIAVIETDDFRTFSPARTVIEQPFHLSYPCVFVHDNRCYCVPEQHQSGEVVLYEAEEFPDRWVKRASLLTGFAGVDPTVFWHAGRWWMFVTNRSNDDVTHLYLFFADSPLGPWTAHRKNPVKSEKHKVRPAGMPLSLNRALLRPSQDCSGTYGGRIDLHRISSLSTTDFEEHLLGEVGPRQDWPFAAGLHTINVAAGVTVFDAKRRLIARNDFRKTLRRKMRTVLVASGLR